ncbi:MAG TPA: YdjY domain-containing protein [Phycisphaerae bacterium]|nr:YdjY domain-containing protein [Phycisphaerae bacterium]
MPFSKLLTTIATVWMVSAFGCTSRPGRSVVDVPGDRTAPATQPAGRVVDFGPGLRIDYRVPQVEVDSEVVLRQGALELFAYSRAQVPKEHETILRTEVPCERIYQALHLIGLVAGRPMRYDMETKTVELPTGDPVEVLVRYDQEGRTREHSACDWMMNASTKKPMARTHWLFTGSRREEDGQFAANIEGTLVTVVDFPSSLLSLPASHSESDSQLWLLAHTDSIPPQGTRVILVLRPAAQSSRGAHNP